MPLSSGPTQSLVDNEEISLNSCLLISIIRPVVPEGLMLDSLNPNPVRSRILSGSGLNQKLSLELEEEGNSLPERLSKYMAG